MQEKIIGLIEDILDLQPGTITIDSKIDEIDGWDSLAHVLIIGGLESELGISVPLEEAIEISSVKELLEKAGI